MMKSTGCLKEGIFMDTYDIAREIMATAHKKGLTLTEYLIGNHESEEQTEIQNIVNQALASYRTEGALA